MSLSTMVYHLVKDRVSYEKLVHDIRYNESSKIVKRRTQLTIQSECLTCRYHTSERDMRKPKVLRDYTEMSYQGGNAAISCQWGAV